MEKSTHRKYTKNYRAWLLEGFRNDQEEAIEYLISDIDETPGDVQTCFENVFEARLPELLGEFRDRVRYAGLRQLLIEYDWALEALGFDEVLETVCEKDFASPVSIRRIAEISDGKFVTLGENLAPNLLDIVAD